MDVIISIVLCYLFIGPIKQVLNEANNEKTDNTDKHTPSQSEEFFTFVYIKYALLTSISIILNLIGLSLYLFKHLTILIEVTSAISCICIVLMYRKYQPLFDCFCGCCVHRCMKRKRLDEHPGVHGITQVTNATNDNDEMLTICRR